ncbi:DUF6578 domain-containing protein [Streptomyces sp. NPDC004787]|uniref:DUF6578 domain-containing protein n=1 Tax=Streptomyces sp. NPDC004787 TaxID=3154291 RepID=UPI0033B67FCB
MTLTIWVDDWQMQCCGERFAPGDVVSWTLLEADPEEGRTPTSVKVVSIAEVHCRYAVPEDATDKVNHPVPGTTELVPVEEADGWAKARPGVRFVGYLVTARPA